MTREAFIAELDRIGYLYKIEGNKIVVTGGNVYENVYLNALTSLPPDVEFRNGGDVWLQSLTSLPPGVEFRNKGSVGLNSLPSLPPGVEFRNEGSVDLRALTSLPSGVEFRNKGDVKLQSFIGGYFGNWKGNIEGIASKRLLNVMIKQGVFQ